MSQFIIKVLEGALAGERSRIVGLCATLTGNADVAEDLAQEVLLEAWRSIGRLRDAEQFSQWLSGIARNVCLRWERKQGRYLAHLALPQADEEMPLEDQLAADVDLEVELERKELVELLDRALAVLPAATRDVLVARYVEESSLAEVAQLQEYIARSTEEWVETSAWCTICGRHRLLGQFRPADAALFLVCPACGDYNHTNLAHTCESQMFLGMQRVKPALSRLHDWTHRYYRQHLDTLEAPCLRCGRMKPLLIASSLKEVDAERFSGRWLDDRGVYLACDDCRLYNWTSLEGLALALPEGQRFLREHTRIRTLPDQEVEADGRTALVTRFESVTDQARFEVLSTSDTYRVLRINGRRP